MSPSVVFYLCGLCSLPSFVIPLMNDPVFQACPSPGRKGPTRQTLQTRLVCCVLFSCLVLAPLMLSISFFHLLFVFSLSIDRHSFFGQSTSRLRPSRPAHTTLRFLSRYLFRSLILSFIFYFLFVFSLSTGPTSFGSQRLACHSHDTRTRHSGIYFAICFVLSIFSSSSFFYVFLSLSLGTPRLGSQRLACHLHDPRTRPSGFFFAFSFVLSFFSPLSCVFYCFLSLSYSRFTPFFLSLSLGTPRLGSQRLACHLNDPRTRPSGFFFAFSFVLSFFSSLSCVFSCFLSLSYSRFTPFFLSLSTGTPLPSQASRLHLSHTFSVH